MNKEEGSVESKDEMKEGSSPSASLRSYPHQKVFKKCKSATFHLDGAIYTIALLVVVVGWFYLSEERCKVLRVLMTYSSNVGLGTHVNEKKEKVQF
ncbi:hypothetical protein M0804_012078 [Polistes exclamans]|nr:hypothetical protein M0804_012078 [Polistes exclamans]